MSSLAVALWIVGGLAVVLFLLFIAGCLLMARRSDDESVRIAAALQAAAEADMGSKL